MTDRPRTLPALATATLLLAVCLPGSPASAEDSGAAPSPPIQIVDEGGVAESYRRDGGDFAAYGPEGEARKPTPQAQALQALAAAHDVQFVSLDAAPAGAACPTSDCVGGFAVLGRVKVASVTQLAIADQTLGGWLREPGADRPDCVPEYHHALAFSDRSHSWEVLLGYDCGRYLIRRDGVELAKAAAHGQPGLAEFNALLAAAKIRHWDADKRQWQEPAVE